jgi:hypothetical protein
VLKETLVLVVQLELRVLRVDKALLGLRVP